MCVLGYIAEGDSDPQQQRIAQLESTIESLHTHIASLQQDVSTATKQVDESAVADAVTRAEAAEKRLKRTENEAQELAQQIGMLQNRLARGEFDPEKTQVLHLRLNPEAEAHKAAIAAHIAQLESENEALKENLARMEQAMAGGGDGQEAAAGSGLKIAQLEGELNLMRRKVAETRKASDRLQQVFTKQIALFREAIAALFGYKVEMSADPTSK